MTSFVGGVFNGNDNIMRIVLSLQSLTTRRHIAGVWPKIASISGSDDPEYLYSMLLKRMPDMFHDTSH